MKDSAGEKLRVNVDRIPDEGLAIQAMEPTDRFPALKDVVLKGEADFDPFIKMEIRLRRAGEFVEAFGRLETTVRLSCSRCLVGFSQPLTVPFEATYCEATRIRETFEKEGEIQLTADAVELFPIRGRELDLLEAIQEQVLLALPMRPLCREDCKGLCPRCGEDLNKGSCGCGDIAADPRLAMLAQLKLEK